MGDESTQRRRARPRVDAFTFLLHWGLVAALLVSLATGLRIASDYGESTAGRIAGPLVPVLPEGAVILWHVWSAWILTFIAISYGAFLWRSRQAVRVALNRSVWQRLRRRGRWWSNLSTWFAINILIYNVAFVLVGLMALTGWMLYRNTTFGLSQAGLATFHGLLAIAFLGYILVHVLSQLKTGTFWKMFRPRLDYAAAAGLAVLFAAVAVTGAAFTDSAVHASYAIARVAGPPRLDGDPADTVWRAQPAARIQTARGANLPGGETTVEVKAVHDGARVYFRFRWSDPQRSQKHLPLVKTSGGWKVMQSRYEINDEDEYYEDKFAVALAETPKLASGTVHLGQNLIEGPHQPATRGLHFTEDGSLLDMWHWKSVRTGGMQPARVDDNFFGPPRPSDQAGARYTGGYSQDPASGGGYALNWIKLDADRPLGDARVQPRFLPARPEVLDQFVEADLASTSGDSGRWYLHASEVVPYDPSLDTYPEGTVLPGVVIKGAFGGDRGDLAAGAEWRDGFWTLEVGRDLDTGSRFDIPFRAGRDLYMWVAVFNHSQTRHSQHLHPLRLRLQ
ncbi:MAG TPA: ethylbenzene dehydrogenase-related protein [Geminicoccaceae bacterium]